MNKRGGAEIEGTTSGLNIGGQTIWWSLLKHRKLDCTDDAIERR
jgi:hypothetical protein